MALIKCTECGYRYSEQSFICPSCGCPNHHPLSREEVLQRDEIVKREKRVNQKKIGKALLLLGLAYGLIGSLFAHSMNWSYILIISTSLYWDYYIIRKLLAVAKNSTDWISGTLKVIVLLVIIGIPYMFLMLFVEMIPEFALIAGILSMAVVLYLNFR